MFSVAVPVTLLSIAPHQEARFLLPVILPLCLFTGHRIFGGASSIAIKV